MPGKKRRRWLIRAVKHVKTLILSGIDALKKLAEIVGLYSTIKRAITPYVPKVLVSIKNGAASLCTSLKSVGLGGFSWPACSLQSANLGNVVLVAMVAGSLLFLYGIGLGRTIFRI
jgi:hypothetical protein